MVKKRKGETISKVEKHVTHFKKEFELEESLAKNIIELQKIHVDLAEKFDKMAKEISNLLALFELTARSFAKNVPMGEMEKDKDFLDKIDKLLDQNKTLAKGLMLMEERLRERMYGPNEAPKAMAAPQMPQAQFSQVAQQQAPQKKEIEEEKFQPSMASQGSRPLPKF